jgi:ankyrin repeat protein
MNAAAWLLEKGAAVNPSDKDGNTPLHWAAAQGHVEMTELLIAHGADLKAKTRFGCTPLRGAYDYHQAATAQVLLQHGATQ